LLLKQRHLFRNSLVFDGHIIFRGHVYAPSSDFSWVRNDKNQDNNEVLAVVFVIPIAPHFSPTCWVSPAGFI
jgi:hypothetical protein